MNTTFASLRHDWTLAEAVSLFELPFNDLLFQAHGAHRANFDPNAVQLSTLLSIKTGACPEANTVTSDGRTTSVYWSGRRPTRAIMA